MQDFGTKADNSAPPGGQLSAAEFNNLATENENAVSRSGQTLSGASATQLATSLFLHGVKSETFQDSGAANAYVATPASGSSGVLLPANYAALNGTIISFKAAFANTAASTLNIGQTTGTLLGSKAIRTSSDTAIPANSIAAGQYVRLIYNSAFDTGNGAWELLRGSIVGFQVITASGTYTPTVGMRYVKVRYVGGGGGSGIVAATTSTQTAAAGGGASGSYGEAILTAGQIGASQSVTIGTAGVGGTAGSGGGTGGTSTLGALLSAPGGQGSPAGVAVATTASGIATGGVSGAATTGGNVFNTAGQQGEYGITITSQTLGGTGGSNPVGVGGQAGGVSFTPTSGSGYGAGAGGVANGISQAAKVGIAGLPGVFIFEEYA